MTELVYIRDAEPYISPKGCKVKRAVYLCYCGKEFTTYPNHVRSGNTKSCGCFHNADLSSRVRKHGLSGSPIYTLWTNMMYRCYNEKSEKYKDYGGRGIKVCDQWHVFENFYEYILPIYEPEKYMDRIENNQWYQPGNIRFATAPVSLGNRRVSHYVEYNGEIGLVTQISRKIGIYYGNIKYYTKKGLSFQEAVDLILSRRKIREQKNLQSKEHSTYLK